MIGDLPEDGRLTFGTDKGFDTQGIIAEMRWLGVPSHVEADRLAAMRKHDILDTPLDPEFDDFVQIAAHVCHAPIAVVNLIDEARQVFAGEIGLGVRKTPLDNLICAQAILQPDVFVIPDLSKDGRFNGNPLVTGPPYLLFYAGALIETPSGFPLGTVCVLDYEPRPDGLTSRQASTLRALARQVMTNLELRRAVAEKNLLVLEAHHRVKNSLQMLQSLMTLQARMSKYGEAAQHLRESAARIHTFAAMHEQLYSVGASTHVNLADYLRKVLDGQRDALSSMLVNRSISFNAADSVFWLASDAPAVGLIVMELVTNALKYGRGVVNVAVQSTHNEILLTVSDEGNALPVDYLPATSKGLGMRVINGLLRARQGHLLVDRTRDHTCFVAAFRR